MPEDSVESKSSNSKEVSNRAQVFELEIGRRSAQQYLDELNKRGVELREDAIKILHSPSFKTLERPTTLKLGIFKAGVLAGLDVEQYHKKFQKAWEEGGVDSPKYREILSNSFVTNRQVYEGAKRLGLELCPPEVGPAFIIESPELLGFQMIGMKPIITEVENDVTKEKVKIPQILSVGYSSKQDPEHNRKSGLYLGTSILRFDSPHSYQNPSIYRDFVFQIVNSPTQ